MALARPSVMLHNGSDIANHGFITPPFGKGGQGGFKITS